MKKHYLLSILSFLLAIHFSSAQTPGPLYRQFYFNPYLFNPAYVGINDAMEVNLVHRQQWTNFKDAPVTTGVSLQFPTSERVSLGLNIHSDKQVLLRNTNFMATFGYVVPIASNQSLRFALSGGVGLNKLDLTAEEMNTNDPTILNATGNNFYVDGNFGVVYSISGLRLGFALTDLFTSNAFNGENFNKFEFSNLRNRLFSASYRFNLDPMGKVALEPYALFRQTQDGIQDYWEVATLVHFKENIWTGVSYNQNNGLALFLGANIKEKFRFGYSYEFPPFSSGFNSGSSHELHLGIRFGKKSQRTASKSASKKLPVLANANDVIEEPSDENINDSREVEAAPDKETRHIETTDPVQKDNEIAKTNVTEPPATKAKDIVKTAAPGPKEAFTMTKGHYYVVVGVFSSMNHSMKFTKDMMAKGEVVNVALNPKNNLYYVYLKSTTDQADAVKMRNEYRWKNLFKEAWVFKME
ncbi:MAG TPA: PorP/SprF family type IX secretion system membrane protein [Chryseolinea sp.]|nr:PorP/SprF family type IX secretion system membrane protein [Chryseolinea sp.]